MITKKLLLLLLILPLIFTIQSCGNESGSGYQLPGPGDPVYIKLKPARYAAQTYGCIDFYAEVHDANGKLLANIPVTFTNLAAPFGRIFDSCGGTEIAQQVIINTDNWGRARITLYSAYPGFATILAQVSTGSQPRDRKTVLFSDCDSFDCLVLAPSLELDVDSEPPDGYLNETRDFRIFDPPETDDKANLYATVRDQYDIPVFNAHVIWASDHAEASFVSTGYTDTNGVATALVQFTPLSLSESETHVNVWAYSDNVSAYVLPFDIVTFFLQPVYVETITVNANPSTVSPDGTSTITAMPTLNTGDPVPDGVSVIFTASCGSVDPFAQTESGIATASYTAPGTAGTCTVTASINGVSGSTSIIVEEPAPEE